MLAKVEWFEHGRSQGVVLGVQTPPEKFIINIHRIKIRTDMKHACIKMYGGLDSSATVNYCIAGEDARARRPPGPCRPSNHSMSVHAQLGRHGHLAAADD